MSFGSGERVRGLLRGSPASGFSFVSERLCVRHRVRQVVCRQRCPHQLVVFERLENRCIFRLRKRCRGRPTITNNAAP